MRWCAAPTPAATRDRFPVLPTPRGVRRQRGSPASQAETPDDEFPFALEPCRWRGSVVGRHHQADAGRSSNSPASEDEAGRWRVSSFRGASFTVRCSWASPSRAWRRSPRPSRPAGSLSGSFALSDSLGSDRVYPSQPRIDEDERAAQICCPASHGTQPVRRSPVGESSEHDCPPSDERIRRPWPPPVRRRTLFRVIQGVATDAARAWWCRPTTEPRPVERKPPPAG